MNNELLSKIKHNLEKLIECKNLSEKKTIVFGMNHPGDFIIRQLDEKGVLVSHVIDNNHANEGIVFEGVTVTTPEKALSRFEPNAAVLICSRYYSEMKSQLEKMGYTENTHIFKLLDIGICGTTTISAGEFSKRAELALRGAELAESILARFNALNALVCPVKSQGDVCIVCSFLSAYTDKLRGFKSKSVLVVVGRLGAELAGMFGVKNIYIATQDEIDLLTAAYRLSPKNGPIKILQPYHNYSSFISRLDCYNGLTFLDHYRNWVFGLSETALAESPHILSDKIKIAETLDNLGFKRGETVVISPFANSLQSIPLSFFEKIAETLLASGYKTATNIAGDEKPIKGTIPLHLPLSALIPAVEYAGAYIGIRNGLADLLSSAKCKKVLIYPVKNYAFGSAASLYSIKGTDENALELIYNENTEKLSAVILQYLKGTFSIEQNADA